SPLKSPTAKEAGVLPTGTSEAAVKPPAPSPRRMLTEWLPALATARSGLPSPLKAPTATDSGASAGGARGGAGGRGPVPPRVGQGGGVEVGGGEVELAVAVETPHRHGDGSSADGDGPYRDEAGQEALAQRLHLRAATPPERGRLAGSRGPGEEGHG